MLYFISIAWLISLYVRSRETSTPWRLTQVYTWKQNEEETSSELRFKNIIRQCYWRRAFSVFDAFIMLSFYSVCIWFDYRDVRAFCMVFRNFSSARGNALTINSNTHYAIQSMSGNRQVRQMPERKPAKIGICCKESSIHLTKWLNFDYFWHNFQHWMAGSLSERAHTYWFLYRTNPIRMNSEKERKGILDRSVSGYFSQGITNFSLSQSLSTHSV